MADFEGWTKWDKYCKPKADNRKVGDVGFAGVCDLNGDGTINIFDLATANARLNSGVIAPSVPEPDEPLRTTFRAGDKTFYTLEEYQAYLRSDEYAEWKKKTYPTTTNIVGLLPFVALAFIVLVFFLKRSKK